MRMIRSIFCVGLALAAIAFSMSAPAIAATPTDPGIYEAIKASIETPTVLQVHEDTVALTCETPAVNASRADVRSSVASASLNVASTPVAVEAYSHIDPDIAGRAGI